MKRILSRSLALSLCLLLPLLAMLGACSRAPQYVFTLSAENPSSGVGGSTSMTATLTNRGAPVSGQDLVFTWIVKGSSQTPLSSPTLTTNASGQATYTLNNAAEQGGHRTITVTVTLESDPAITATVDVQFGDALLPGFIALSKSRMTWADAIVYCQQQGGRLPRINDSDSWSWDDRNKITRIDGFGARGAPWPAGLPFDFYWTGVEVTDYPGFSWLVRGLGGSVLAFSNRQSDAGRVVCVP